MDKQELIKLCDEFNAESMEMFSNIVSVAIEQGVSAKRIAKEFQCAESTVMRWKSGVARPHPFLREDVVCWVRSELK